MKASLNHLVKDWDSTKLEDSKANGVIGLCTAIGVQGWVGIKAQECCGGIVVLNKWEGKIE